LFARNGGSLLQKDSIIVLADNEAIILILHKGLCKKESI
jgi:hypothetical protein